MRFAQRGAARSAAIAVLFACSPALLAQNAPQPPCAGLPVPNYAAIGQQPVVQVWRKSGKVGSPPPPCSGWSDAGGNLAVALAGTFRYAGGTDELLNRFGAISTLRGIRYWSVTDRDWRELVKEAVAVGGPDGTVRRPDFAAGEMKANQNLYFAQRDSRSTGEVVYRMRVIESAANRIIVEVENVTAVRTFFITVFDPGAMKTRYFLDRLENGNWVFYALLSADSSFAAGNEASFINRADAYYRHFTGMPTDGSPPLAR